MTPEKGTDVNFVMRVYDERIHLGGHARLEDGAQVRLVEEGGEGEGHESAG